MHRYGVKKTYTHEQGLSCCFRQWKADHSHCQYLHGYAIQVALDFESEKRDSREWVIDFGGLDPFKEWLKETFDHKTLVAYDDPQLMFFEEMAGRELIQLVKVNRTGCEGFAMLIWEKVNQMLSNGTIPTPPGHKVSIKRVTVSEHGANSAWFEGKE